MNLFFAEKPLGTICSIIVLLLLLIVIFADVLAPFKYMQIHLRDRMQGSSVQYLLDAVRDLLDPRLRGGGGRLGADGAKSV